MTFENRNIHECDYMRVQRSRKKIAIGKEKREMKKKAQTLIESQSNEVEEEISFFDRLLRMNQDEIKFENSMTKIRKEKVEQGEPIVVGRTSEHDMKIKGLDKIALFKELWFIAYDKISANETPTFNRYFDETKAIVVFVVSESTG